MERPVEPEVTEHRAPPALFFLLMSVIVISRSATSILTPIWLDALDSNATINGTDHCGEYISYKHVDAFTTMFIVNVLFFLLFGMILLTTKILCPSYLITDRETSYDKREFALIGISDTLAGICFVYASSGCRTAPYLQSIAANFSVPVTFILRFLILRKRPTLRKTFCAILVLFAEITAMLPEIFPGLESSRARHVEGGAQGLEGVLWPLCSFVGYIPLAFVTIVIEKAVKPRSIQGHDSTEINIAYVLFWCYLFSLLTLVLLFWTDLIPGFGMANGIIDFCQTFYFNLKCYFGFEGCMGLINIVSIACTVFLVVNRVANSYFLRYLEGANYLVIITSIQTPVVFLFFTLFDENPLTWHPHAYLSTWLSIAALCIMIPAIYIYDTGAPEVKPDSPPQVDAETQSDERRPLILHEEGNQPISTQYGSRA